jgi:hypothetical protein
MTYLNKAVFAAVATGFAFIATPVHAQSCTFGAPVAISLDPAGDVLTNQVAFERLVEQPAAKPLLGQYASECRNELIAESLRISGLDPNVEVVGITPAKLAIPTGYTAPPQAPKPAATDVADAEAAVAEARAIASAAEKRENTVRAELEQLVERVKKNPSPELAEELRRLTKEFKAANAEAKATAMTLKGALERLSAVEKTAAEAKALANSNQDRIDTILTKDGKGGKLVELERKLSSQSGSAWSYWDWSVALLALLSAIGVGGIIVWVKKTRRSDKEADAKFATKSEVISIEVGGSVFEELSKLDDSEVKSLDFSTSDGRTFKWPFGRKGGTWFTPTGGHGHSPHHDLITDPAKTLQKWMRKGQIVV